MRWKKVEQAELIVATRDLSIALEHTRRAASLAAQSECGAPRFEQPTLAQVALGSDVSRVPARDQASLNAHDCFGLIA